VTDGWNDDESLFFSPLLFPSGKVWGPLGSGRSARWWWWVDRRFVGGGGKRGCLVDVVGCGVVGGWAGGVNMDMLPGTCGGGGGGGGNFTGMEPSSSTQHTMGRRGQWLLDCCLFFSFHSLIPWPLFFCRTGRGGQVHGRFG
jgi:hypothetical protein